MSKKEHSDENFIMPFGKYKGTALKNVPDEYLYYLHGTNIYGALKRYIDDNIDAIKANINRGRYYNKL